MLDFRLLAISNSANFQAGLEQDALRSSINWFERCAGAGVRAVQLREKLWSDRSRLVAARAMVTIGDRLGAKVLINDRPDIAAMAGAAGVHLPEQGLPIHATRTVFPKQLVGRSCHSFVAAERAWKEGADYILFGPVYETDSKKQFGQPQGINALQGICKQIGLPVFAVGGITPERAAECRAAGAHGVAVIGAMNNTENLVQKIGEFRDALGGL